MDGDPAGLLTCYGGTCRATIALGLSLPPGRHILSVEGGSELPLELATE